MEDYLQEFGRAGRDGKPSVAITFTGKNDVGLLQFMAKHTAKKAPGGTAGQASVLDAKLEAIDEMRRIATSLSLCARKSVIDYFGESTTHRQPSFAVRIVAWLLSRSVPHRATRFCCDRCDGVEASTVVAWASQVFAETR